jgi:hypothetical protein
MLFTTSVAETHSDECSRVASIVVLMYDQQYYHSRILSGLVSVLSDLDTTVTTMSI